MTRPSPWDFWVFRSTARPVPMRALVDELADDVDARSWSDALVRAGQVESAACDQGRPEAGSAADLTDALAEALVGRPGRVGEALMRLVERSRNDGELWVVPPEAFSYYALDPRDVVERLAEGDLGSIRHAAVVGLRSIGTTLSAVVCAAIRARGGHAERRTARPTGAPYDRVTRLSGADAAWAGRLAGRGGHALVVDEGPGASGSSLLSAADALVEAGFARDRVRVVCTRAPDPGTLLARDGARRWSALRVAVVTPRNRLADGFVPLAPGAWRERFLAPSAAWPGCWPWLERAKAIARDGRTLIKFEGLGRHGAQAHARAERLARSGFGPRADRWGDGHVAYEVVRGAPGDPRTLDRSTLARLAEYCAWRSNALPGPEPEPSLGGMVRHNAQLALGLDLEVRLEASRPTIPDARMMPYEWVRTPEGAQLKVDAASHGDDHVFPGPADVAWDLAGAIVEWRMTVPAIDCFLADYTRASADAPRARLPAWLLAYALHRVAWCEFAAATVGACDDGGRLRLEARRYRAWLRWASRNRVLRGLGRLVKRAA